jgi:hypothetical protein
MAIFGLLVVTFAIVAGLCWRQGLWSCAINVINLTLAAVIATNYFEPLANMADATGTNYMMDSIMLWTLFAVSYIVLRLITQMLSDHDVNFIKPVDLAGRSILAIWCGWLFVCFAAFATMTAPVGASPAGAWDTPEAKSFQFMSPEQQWLAFAQSRSMGALSNFNSGAPLHPDDAQSGAQVFDSNGEYTYKYYTRRKKAE